MAFGDIALTWQLVVSAFVLVRRGSSRTRLLTMTDWLNTNTAWNTPTGNTDTTNPWATVTNTATNTTNTTNTATEFADVQELHLLNKLPANPGQAPFPGFPGGNPTPTNPVGFPQQNQNPAVTEKMVKILTHMNKSNEELKKKVTTLQDLMKAQKTNLIENKLPKHVVSCGDGLYARSTLFLDF